MPIKKKSEVTSEKVIKEKVIKEKKVTKEKKEKAEKPVKEKKVTKEKVTKEKKAETPVIPADINTIDSDIIELNCIAQAMLDKKAQIVSSLNLKKIGTAISDYFIVCNADSTPQVLAIADNVEEMMYKRCNRKVVRAQGKENAFWIILDYTNIVVHIFKTEYRQFYRLEDLWADADRKTYTE